MSFSWWLSAWVSSKVVSVGFGGWNGGGMVVGTVIMVVVVSRCCGGFAWWWLGFSLGGPQFPGFLWRLVELLWWLGQWWKWVWCVGGNGGGGDER